ncbi:MAG: Peptidase family [Candidatus Aminicenantes bacterium]|nr:Peptidase family [Candidatus Aminicenantes bacterium]
MKRAPLSPLLIVWAVLASASAGAQTTEPLLQRAELRALNNEISGELAQDYIRDISRFHRLQPSRVYSLAAEWVAEKARKLGFSDVRIEKYPADGKTSYFMSDTSPAWDVEFAELWIVEPKEEKLTSFEEIPLSVAIGSAACDQKGELVYVGEGTSPQDYEKAEVKGRVVFASGPIGPVAALAVDKFGALGVLTINQRFADDEPDYLGSLRISTQTPAFGFGLSRRRGNELRDRILRGEKFTVRARVKAETHPYYYENVIATLPGSDLAAEEVLLTAHLCHNKPGANDNASGSACLLEIGRALRRLIDEGKIPEPKRTIRFLWVPEMSGSIAYVSRHPEVSGRAVDGINLDMVGQYLNKNNSTFFLHLTPHSRPHFINDLLSNLTEFVTENNTQALMSESAFAVHSLGGSRDAFRSRIMPFTGGSDQMIFNDGLIAVPFAFFLVWPDRYYHTSGDQPEQCDPTQLKRSSLLAAAATVFLADDSPDRSRRLAGEAAARAEARLAGELRRGFDAVGASETAAVHDAYKEAVNGIIRALERETAALNTIENYSALDKSVDDYCRATIARLRTENPLRLKELERYYALSCEARQVGPQKPTLTDEEKRAAKICPRREAALKGPVGRDYLREKLKDSLDSLDLPRLRENGLVTYEILNFIDGKNSLLDIRNAVSAEFEPLPLQWVEDYVRLLARAGVVILEK